MTVRAFDGRPREAAQIREEVFVKEQGFLEEFDATDDVAKHLVLFDGEEAVGTCRVFYDETKGSHVVGRLAVRKPWRGRNAGAALLAAAEETIRRAGGSRVTLDAQVRAAGFYEKQGYRRYGEEFLEEHCPHIAMEKEL